MTTLYLFLIQSLKIYFIFLLIAFLVPWSASAQVHKTIRVTNAEKLIHAHKASNDLVILDVRTAKEFSSDRIEGAIHIDFWGAGFVDSVSKLDRNKIYLVYCTSGVRSKKAMKKMRELSFKKVYNLKGGFWAYRRRNRK